jgi:O-antigen/teichoic acid export membrane protein
VITVFTALFELIATAGFVPVMIRGIAADRDRIGYYLTNSLLVLLAATAIVIPAMLLSAHWLHYERDVNLGITLLTFTLPLAIVQQYILAVFEGLQFMRLRSVLSTLDSVTKLVAGSIALYHRAGIVPLAEGLVAARIVTTAVAIALLLNAVPFRFDFRSAARSLALFTASLPFLMVTLTNTTFWSASTLLLSKLRIIEDVGVFNAASRVTDILKNIFYSYLIGLLPLMCASFARSKEEFRSECNLSVKYLSIITVPTAAGISVLAHPIIRLIYGPHFDSAVPVLRLLIWTICVFCLSVVFARALVASHHQILDLYCNIAALTVNVALGWWIIPHMGALGAAAATLAALLLFGFLEYTMVCRKLFYPDMTGPLLKTGAASGLMAAVIYPIRSGPLPVVIGIGALIYVAALLAIGTLSRSELKAIRELAFNLLDAAGLKRSFAVAARE